MGIPIALGRVLGSRLHPPDAWRREHGLAARPSRRLAAILAADVAGYSALVERDEAGTLARLAALRAELIAPLLAEHGGRLVKLMGDGLLAEFASVVDAVACAVAIQERGTGDLALRIGVNLGDVVVEGDDLYGDGRQHRGPAGGSGRAGRDRGLGHGLGPSARPARLRLREPGRAAAEEHRPPSPRLSE